MPNTVTWGMSTAGNRCVSCWLSFHCRCGSGTTRSHPELILSPCQSLFAGLVTNPSECVSCDCTVVLYTNFTWLPHVFVCSHPSRTLMREILHQKDKVCYYSFLMSLAKHETINQTIGRFISITAPPAAEVPDVCLRHIHSPIFVLLL